MVLDEYRECALQHPRIQRTAHDVPVGEDGVANSLEASSRKRQFLGGCEPDWVERDLGHRIVHGYRLRHACEFADGAGGAHLGRGNRDAGGAKSREDLHALRE